MNKLLIFHPYLAPYRIDLYNSLVRLCEVQVLLTGSLNEKKTLGYDLEFVNRQATFKYKYVHRGWYIGRHLFSTIYYQHIRFFRPDFVMAHELGINTLMAIILKPFFEYKLFVTVDDSPAMILGSGSLRRMLRNLIVKHSDVILTVHPQVNSYFESTYKKYNHCRFIYFPLLQDEKKLQSKFLLAETDVHQLISKHNLDGEWVVLFVGRLESVKCPDLLLHAFKKLSTSIGRLVFVGDGSLKEALQAWAKSQQLASKVIFTGRLSGAQLYAWYRIADVFVLPSQFEPFGAVVNEALVAGCQVVVSDRVGANCLIESSNGTVFEANNESSLIEALNSIINGLPDLPKNKLRESKMTFSFEYLLVHFKNLIEYKNEN